MTATIIITLINEYVIALSDIVEYVRFIRTNDEPAGISCFGRVDIECGKVVLLIK